MINEVIETLKAYTDGKDNTGKVEISVMQLNRIIKALEQQPTDAVDRVTIKEYLDSFGKDTNVTATDCISREETLEALMDEWTEYDRELIGWLYDKIDKLPSVTPQPKIGRWNFTKHYGRDYYVCSFCGMERMDDHSSGWNYCPFCGAKMQEVEE